MSALTAPLRPFRADAVAAARAEIDAEIARRTDLSARGLRNVADALEYEHSPRQASGQVLNVFA